MLLFVLQNYALLNKIEVGYRAVSGSQPVCHEKFLIFAVITLLKYIENSISFHYTFVLGVPRKLVMYLEPAK